MKKLILSITAMFLVLLCLAACGKKEQDASSAPAAESSKAEVTAAADPTAEPTPAPEIEDAVPTPAPEDVTHYSSLPAPEVGSDAFVQEFMTNPIDAQYDEDMDNAASGSAMIDACNAAVEGWKKQIDSVYMHILNSADEEKAKEVKKAQEEWINDQNDHLREIRENVDQEDAMAAVTAAENIMLYYRSRAIDLCAVVYELEGQIAFG